MRRGWVACAAIVLTGCGSNPLVKTSDPFAAVVPQSADVAVEGRHDLAFFAVGECHQTIDLTNLLVTTAFTTFFVANGRLDAALALPEALPESVTIGTDCDPIDVELEDLVLVGDAFELENETDTRATLRALAEGTTTVQASFLVSDGTHLFAEGTFRAHAPDRVEVSVACDPLDFGEWAGLYPDEAVAERFVPAASTFPLGYALYAGDVALSGYDYFPIDTGALRRGDEIEGGFEMQTPTEAGTIRLSSPIDPDFAADLEVYDAGTIDEVRIALTQTQAVWSSTPFFAVASFPVIDGRVPCINRVPRTLTIETPEVCRFAEGDPTTHPQTWVLDSIAPVSPGTCRVRARVDGGTATGVLEVPIGRPWEAVDTGHPDFYPWAITGTSATDVIVVGAHLVEDGGVDAAILRYDGEGWQETVPGPSGRLLAAWASGPDDVRVVGEAGLALAWNGETWTPMATGTTEQLYAVFGFGPTNAYALGAAGTLLRDEGDGWTALPTGLDEALLGAWGPGPGSLYLVGQTGTLFHLAGELWTTETLTPIGPVPPDAPLIAAVWGSDAADVWAAGWTAAFHFDGSAWTEVGAFFSTSAIWGSGPDDVVMVGGQRSLRYDGASWVEVPLVDGSSLDGVWGSGPDDVYGVDRDDGVLHLRR